MSKGILNEKDWSPSPEQRQRDAMGLNAQGVIVDIGKYLGVELEPISNDPQPIFEGLAKWAAKHHKTVCHLGDTAWFHSTQYEFRIQVRLTRRQPSTAEYVGTVLNRKLGRALHITDGHTKIPNVLSEFREFIEFQKRIKA